MRATQFIKGVAEADINAVDINQVAGQMKFLPTTKQAKQYKFVKDGVPGQMLPMTYTVATQQQPVVTVTSDGKETQNIAATNDIIMSGPSKENYVVKAAKFPKLYQGTLGGTVVPEQSPRLVALYTGKTPVTFTAPWGESMILKPGDYLVKDGDAGYYRVAKIEYKQTYNEPGQKGVAEGRLNEFAPGGNSASSYYAVTSNFVNDFAQQKQEELQDLIDAGWTKQDLAQAGTLQGQAADIAHLEQVRDGFLKGLKPGFDAYLQGDTQLKDQLGAFWLDNDLPLNQDWESIYDEPLEVHFANITYRCPVHGPVSVMPCVACAAQRAVRRS
jgi:hypothetical protein